MKRLWAPWRIGYLTKDVRKPRQTNDQKTPAGACVFCEAVQQKPSSRNLVLYRDKHAFVILNKFPYANGHLMVLPRRHAGDFSQLTRTEHAVMGILMAKCQDVLKATLGCDGLNIGMNLGSVAGAGIPGHLHYHVVPRWVHDHNFMPTIAETRTIPEHMLTTYRKLKRHFNAP